MSEQQSNFFSPKRIGVYPNFLLAISLLACAFVETGWAGTNPILTPVLLSTHASGSKAGLHSADVNADYKINLSELLRVVQFFNIGGYHCALPEEVSEDGYIPGFEGNKDCPPHDSDYNPTDWQINLSELLRLIQLFNFGEYSVCISGEDGFCPGESEGTPEGQLEGSLEGQDEGQPEGEGSAEGQPEGNPEGVEEGIPEGEGTVEGFQEGLVEGEGTSEGEPEGTAEGAIEGEPEGQVEQEISIIGWVTDNYSNPLSYVTIELIGTEYVAMTNPNGLYILYDIPQGAYVLSASQDGYAPYSIQVEVGEILPVTVNIVLIQQIKVQDVPDIENGATVTDSKGNSITIPPNSVFDENGNPVTGTVEVYITPIDFSSPNDIYGFPGGFEGITAEKTNGNVTLESFGLADFTLKQDGKELQLDTSADPNVNAEIILDLPDDSPLNDGEIVPLWYFDEEQGVWVESGGGLVVEEDGNKYYIAPVQHLSWWNADKPITDKTCIQGYIKDKVGTPIAGALVKAVGVSYNGITTSVTDSSGAFCVDVKGNSTVKIEVYLAGGQTLVYQAQVNANTVGNSCQIGTCIDIGTITIIFDSCVKGTVTDSNGNPQQNVTVYSSVGTSAITNSNGQYCLDAIGGIQTTIYVISRPPVIVTPQVNTSCENGNCVVADINVEYPSDGAYIGLINVSSKQLNTDPNDPPQYIISSSAIFASLPNNPIGEIGEECSVEEVQFGPGESLWTEEFLPQITWSGLDPGAPGTFQLDNQSVSFLRMANTYLQIGGSVQPWMYSLFQLDYNNPIYTAQAEPTFNTSWPGGLDLGAFTVSGQIPPPLVVTAPQVIVSGGYQVLPNEDIHFEWVAPETPAEGSYIEIKVVGNRFNPDRSFTKVTILCRVPDTGAYTIPFDLRQQLPTGGMESYVQLGIYRCYSSEVLVPLSQGGQGKFIIVTRTGTSVFAFNP